MDLIKEENDDLKVQRKLLNTANKIRKNRRDSKKLKKETQEFKEIRELLNISEHESQSAEPKVLVPKAVPNSLASCNIPISAPAIEIFREDEVFSLFNQESLRLKDFLDENEGHDLFGEDAEVPKEDLFRESIAHRLFECFLPRNEKRHNLNLYVLYLLSVHTDKDFVSACVDYLKYQHSEFTGAEIFPIFVNFGATTSDLIGTDYVELPIKFKRQNKNKDGEKVFPYVNAEMVADVLLFYANLNLIKKEEKLKLLVQALTRLTLDSKIRSSHLFAGYSLLLGTLASKLAEVLELDDVVSCLHLENEHVLNQVEVARVVHMPISSTVHAALTVKTINSVLKQRVLKISNELQVKDLVTVLKILSNKERTPLEIYCILQLINGSLPNVTATAKEAGDITNILICMETGLLKVSDSVDLIRLKLEIAKARNLLLGNVDKTCMLNYLNGDDRETCLKALRTYGIVISGGPKIVGTLWLSQCFGEKKLLDTEPFEFAWTKQEMVPCASGDRQDTAPAENKEDASSPMKRMKIDSEKYLCSQPSTSNRCISETRQLIIDELQKLADAFAARNDTWRAFSYRKAVSAISRHKEEITTLQEACNIPGIGNRMALKIMEIIESGRLTKVEHILDGKTKVLQTFCNVWGAGPSTAESWYLQGHRDLKDLMEKGKLTKQQEIGLKYYDDFLERMSREEVERIAGAVEEELKHVHGHCRMEIVGSYWRRKPTCGDVDIMLVSPGVKRSRDILLQLTRRLKQKDLLTDDLVALDDSTAAADEGDHRKYMGVFRFPGGYHRRIDIFVVPEDEYAAGLMHYTGSAAFNRSIRLIASRKGFHLSERGLYTGAVRKGSDLLNVGELVPTPTEKDIFRCLGLEFREPEERDH